MASSQADLQAHSKRLVRGISFQQKLAILRQLEAGIPRKEICENLQCCQSTISRVLVAKHEILQVAEQDKNHNRRSGGMVTYKDIDDKLSKWAQEMKNNNQMITANSAKKKAEEIAREMGEEDFIPSAGWLYKWKERENIQFCKKAKAGEHQLIAVGGKEILKGLLERQEDVEVEYMHKSKEITSSKNESCSGNEHLAENDNLTQQNVRHMQENCSLMHQDFIRTNDTQELLSQQDTTKRSHNIDPQPMPAEQTTSENESEIPVKKRCNIVTDSVTSMADLGPSSRSILSTSKTEPKKILYSYNPVYVLTSSGRYRKEKTFLTLLQKLKILKRLKNGEKRTDLINEYRLSQSAMCQIIADEKKITRMADIGQNLHMKRIRGGIFKAGESELNAWVLEKMDNGEMLTRNQVKNKAKEIAARKKIEFKASTGWLEKWKARMNMDFNDKHILYRKTPQYINKSDLLEANVSLDRESVSHEEEEDDDNDDSHMHLRERHSVENSIEENDGYNMDYSVDHSLDIKPFNDSQEKYHPEVIAIVDEEGENEDVKPVIERPRRISPVDDSEPDEEQSLHQQIISWLNKYNIAPTAATELLTVLHPVISDNPEAPHQTRLTITTKPASRSKGRPYAQHTYS